LPVRAAVFLVGKLIACITTAQDSTRRGEWLAVLRRVIVAWVDGSLLSGDRARLPAARPRLARDGVDS